ncbi:hypothetical protein COL91_27635 [Bacillus pseudomycoides]|nr:hypothetical protein COO02_22545 [Bacillus pseudomycoides]PEI94081.1 hypothetical protein CN679_06390 [Bacillus pseudomycoides]PGA81149.1 hypothetical protein COL91_27635 [Bacillus pseudomycoides]PHF39824.1 hypothetical protein COF72_21810 [Bacillus pseudomycoides]
MFPTTLTFPFSEMLVFTMLFPYLKNRNQAKKVGIIAMIVSGLNLTVLQQKSPSSSTCRA